MPPLPALNPWFAAAPIAFGLLFVGLGVNISLSGRRRRRSWTARTGTIVGSRMHDGMMQHQVAFDEGGREVRFWHRYQSSGAGVAALGRSVDILVNPENSADAVVVRGAARPLSVALAFLAFGALATAIGVALLAIALR